MSCLKKLQSRQSREKAKRVEADIRRSTAEIESQAEKEISMIRAIASAEATKNHAKVEEDVVEVRDKAKKEIEKLAAWR